MPPEYPSVEYSKLLGSVLLVVSLIIPQLSLAHGDVHQRIDALSESLAIEVDADLLVKRAMLFRDDGYLKGAWGDYQQALALAPENVEALYFGAKTALDLSLTAQVRSLAGQFSRVIQRNSNPASQARVHALFSDVYLAENKLPEAIEYLEQSIHLQSQPAPDRWLALAHLSLRHKGYTEALRVLKAAHASSRSSLVEQEIVELAMLEKDYLTAIEFIDVQLVTAGSLRKVKLLALKSNALLASGKVASARLVRNLAVEAFSSLPSSRKSQPLGQVLWKELSG